MDKAFLIQKLTEYGDLAPWMLFGLVLLAGVNFPISIDLLLIASAVISATVFPEKVGIFFAAFTFGCICSAWIAYWIGRKLGGSLLKFKFFSKILNAKRILQISQFYQKYGFWTFLVGRFIPFGVRNCLFMSSGISQMSFVRFVCFDFIACSIWSSLFFFLFYRMGQNYDMLMTHIKIFNICIFAAFSVTVISLICYKIKKKNKPTC